MSLEEREVAGYGWQEASELSGVAETQLRALVRAGCLVPREEVGGAKAFGFQDIVFLRKVSDLLRAEVPFRYLAMVLRRLRRETPSSRHLAALQLEAAEGKVLLKDRDRRFVADSGQAVFTFEDEVEEEAVPSQIANLRPLMPVDSVEVRLGPEEWFQLGCELEERSPLEARDAYRRALELRPGHAKAHVNLGRILHASDEREAAAEHYQIAVQVDPQDAIAWFNLGVVMEDLKNLAEAALAYRNAVDADPQGVDAYVNLAALYERQGQAELSLQVLSEYRRSHPDRR